MTNYASGNEYLDKLHWLIEDLESNENNYSTWEMDFISSFNLASLEIGDDSLSSRQEEKIDELYDKHFGD